MEEGKRPRTYSGVLTSMCYGYEEALSGGSGGSFQVLPQK